MIDPKDLELENQDLTEAIVNAYDSIESAIELTDYLDTLTSASPMNRILELTGERLNSLIPFEVSSFYLVNEETGELELHSCRPVAEADNIKDLIAAEMKKGNIHIALRDQRPMLRHIDSSDKNRLLLHSISTARRSRGLFAGVFSHGHGHEDRLTLLLFTLILSHCANALESAALYEMVHRANTTLTNTVEKNRKLFNQLNMGTDEILHLVRHMLKSDSSVGPEEKANRLTVLRVAYRYFTQTGIPEEKALREIITAVVRHYSATFSLESYSPKLSVTGSNLKINLIQGILIALALYEILASLFHRRPQSEWEQIKIGTSLDRMELQISISASQTLVDQEKEGFSMLRFLLTNELGGSLAADPSTGVLRLHIPLS